MLSKDRRGAGRAAGHDVTVLVAVLIGAISTAGCGAAYEDTISGLPAEQGFIAQGSDERATIGCLRQSIEAAEALLRNPDISDLDMERLRQSTGDSGGRSEAERRIAFL